ncbi:MAG TPA: PaaI family thioesterase [Actinomycetota bacterium]|nr:PaaI family thioesterase [Actinomycetota bacterium]
MEALATELNPARIRTRQVSWEDPIPLAEAALQMSGLEFLRSMIGGRLPRPPIAALLGFTLVDVGEGWAVFEGEVGEEHYNPIGVVHGGLAGMLADSAMGCAVQSTLPAGSGYTTLEYKVNLVRPITAETRLVRCRAEAVHVGRRTATAEARVTDAGGRLFAHATTTCLILHPEE